MIPKPAELIREAAIVIGGAIIAAAIMSQFPQLKSWIKRAWD